MAVSASARVTQTMFRVVPVVVSAGAHGPSIQTHALMDTASSVTLIDEGLANDLGLSGVRTEMAIAWTDGKSRPMTTEQVSLTISSRCGQSEFAIKAQTMKGMDLPLSTVDEQCLVDEGLADLPITRLVRAKPMILIGQDNVELLTTGQSRMGISRRMVASESVFGWMVEGQEGPVRGQERCMVTIQGEEAGRLEKMVELYIEAENLDWPQTIVW